MRVWNEEWKLLGNLSHMPGQIVQFTPVPKRIRLHDWRRNHQETWYDMLCPDCQMEAFTNVRPYFVTCEGEQ